MTADPWALLREAQRLIAANRLMLGHYSGVREVGSLEDRIDAALAERAEGSTEDVVESKTRWWPSHQETVIDGACARVWLQDAENWGWWIFKDHGVRDTGFAKTEVEAKEAAIAAARGLK